MGQDRQSILPRTLESMTNLVEVFLRAITGNAVGSQVVVPLELLDGFYSLGSTDAISVQIESEHSVEIFLKGTAAIISGVGQFVIPRAVENNPIGIRRNGIDQILAGDIPIVFDPCNRIVVGDGRPAVGCGVDINSRSIGGRIQNLAGGIGRFADIYSVTRSLGYLDILGCRRRCRNRKGEYRQKNENERNDFLDMFHCNCLLSCTL